MARIRTIKPEFWTDEKLAKVSRDARLLFAALLNMAEDHGVARANPSYVRGQAFPYDTDVAAEDIGRWLVELEREKFVKRFGYDGQAFLFIVNFNKHQKIDRPSKPTLPQPPENILDEGSTSAQRGLDEGSLLERKGEEGKGKERKGEEDARAPLSVPLVYEVPEKPEEEWDAQDFFRWAQSRRIASGLLGEKWPRPEKLRDFWLSVSHARVSVRRLQEAFYRYGADPWWERPDVKPAHPWSGFQSQWEKYVPQEQAA